MKHPLAHQLWKRGDVFVWITGVTLAFSVIMVTMLVLCLLLNGLETFWPKTLYRFSLKEDKVALGQITGREATYIQGKAEEGTRYRVQLKQANRDVYGIDFIWVDEDQILDRKSPSQALVIERREWGDFYGFIKEVQSGGEVIARGHAEGMAALDRLLPRITGIWDRLERIEKNEIGAINYKLEKNRLKLRKLALKGINLGEQVAEIERKIAGLQEEYKNKEEGLVSLRAQLAGNLVMTTAEGTEKVIPLNQVFRVYSPNTFGIFSKLRFFGGKIVDFISQDPRESNTEGGVFPAIFGTVLMVFLMSLFATPLGVLAGFYLREYAAQGFFVSMVRIAVNNLAGVPSIVFGVFGVGFFIYFIGGSIDKMFFAESLPAPTFGTGGILWASLTMALLTVPVVIVSTEEGLASVPKGVREGSLALGATKFETTMKVVLPAVSPSILTGLILAMARAAGEVAPLMITGVVKMAPALPIDGFWPFIHLDRKFMHLGFHIFDVGFQSPNVDAARAMVFATTLLLILLVLLLNLAAIFLRNRIRRKLEVSAV
ncbi:MAG: phosphate ABC transporter, permease protein PstA [Nitrospinae bacterium CG11_big_fil_rev_8_21_14_0_20_56_8]|nr:MAG: phosphate ABC transporter, permease protein PstA [Nitrospinae bacterium CG11_big_fil_rev_8_21_14_0_20_56_8]